MSYTRRISPADTVDAGYPGYQVVVKASPESATVLAGFLDNGGEMRSKHPATPEPSHSACGSEG